MCWGFTRRPCWCSQGQVLPSPPFSLLSAPNKL
jgi:hypothetical protein